MSDTKQLIETLGLSVIDLEETLGALQGKHGEGWINISMEERRVFASLLKDYINALDTNPRHQLRVLGFRI
jgi:hypothetical protein